MFFGVVFRTGYKMVRGVKKKNEDEDECHLFVKVALVDLKAIFSFTSLFLP